MEAIENFLIPFPYKVAKAMDPLTYRYLNLFSVFKFTFYSSTSWVYLDTLQLNVWKMKIVILYFISA